jgi:hypothetical protein
MSCTWPACWDHVFSSLESVKLVGKDSWAARCPAHQDDHPSLTLRVGNNGALLVRCQRNNSNGCTSAEVMNAINCTLEDLYPDNKRHTGGGFKREGIDGRVQENVYDYRDEKGDVLFQVVRFRYPDGKKEFRQRHWDPVKRDWIWNIAGVRRVLYRLPELLDAKSKRPKEPVFIVEGEKAAEKLRDVGFTATTNSGGAGKFSLTDYSHLAGCDAVVLPDNDAYDERHRGWIGQDHAEEVCRLIFPTARRVRYVDLPGLAVKGDAYDWIMDRLDAGEKTELIRRDLLEVVDAEPPWVPPDRPHPLIAAMQDARVQGRWASHRQWTARLIALAEKFHEEANDAASALKLGGLITATLARGMAAYYGVEPRPRSRPGGPGKIT